MRGAHPLAVACVCLIAASLCGQDSLQIVSSNAEPPTVGMEGRIEVVLPQRGLTTLPKDHRSPLLLRIASEQPHGTLTRYDLRYIGRVPGEHDLREYLFSSNGIPATNLPVLTVKVAGLLPDPYNGWLEEEAQRTPSLFGGYRGAMILIGVLWVASLFFILRVGRAKAVDSDAPTEARERTFAERLRPLVERAAAGQLSADEKASLERMLINHWQRRLGLEAAGGEELIAQLRAHPEAGALLRALEDWLHRPPGAVSVSVEKVLEPYRHLPADEPEEVSA